ncbi:hypothetical protein ASF61_07005 [Duganella sp. Leaf126]|uniref:TauD/TfdA family dioxygenase n=1 Tax=Duganella sp. Leaf126 TaxID=1736266 RepID=UPI0006FC2CF6|nr:TauD/TfdA family dioxygenase [Duganella sp. Leaf126]KQQ35961.1 hypothetical protein ASF61_07005 [Duganella sp. Leaf126]
MGIAFQQSPHVFVTQRDFDWGQDQAAIIALVGRYFSDFNGNGFYPHRDEVVLREQLLAVPSLHYLQRYIAGAEARGLAITGLGLAGLAEAERNALLYAISLSLGYPTSTDQRTQRVAWDIRARPGSAQKSSFVTFSERVGSADMHTDSSFYPMPEEQFLLYVVTAAACGGGASLLIGVDDIYAELQRTEAGRAAFTLLSDTALPFRVPSVYAASDDQVEIEMAPVFERRGDTLTMRWRHDSLIKGLAARPAIDTPDVGAALALLNEVIEQRAPRFCQQLPDDTLLWVDNRRALHGRADYSDPARHLIRIRISDMPNAERVGPSGISAD